MAKLQAHEVIGFFPIFCLQTYRKMLGKIYEKEDKIRDLDDVLKYADVNDDGIIDFDEWRQDLIK